MKYEKSRETLNRISITEIACLNYESMTSGFRRREMSEVIGFKRVYNMPGRRVNSASLAIPVSYGKLVRKVREPARTFFDYFLPLWRKGPISCTGGSRNARTEGGGGNGGAMEADEGHS